MAEYGDVPYYWKKYTAQEARPFLNNTYKDKQECFKSVRNYMMKNFDKDCSCPLACKETQFKAHYETMEKDKDSEFWFFNVYNEDTKVTNIVEVPDYTIEDLLGAVGGILGLTIGASSLSIIELIVYFAMSIVRKIY